MRGCHSAWHVDGSRGIRISPALCSSPIVKFFANFIRAIVHRIEISKCSVIDLFILDTVFLSRFNIMLLITNFLNYIFILAILVVFNDSSMSFKNLNFEIRY